MELSYAITIHKSMGSEYDIVIIPLMAAHRILLSKNLIYTAITRAKRRVLLIGEKRRSIWQSRKTARESAIPIWDSVSNFTIKQ